MTTDHQMAKTYAAQEEVIAALTESVKSIWPTVLNAAWQCGATGGRAMAGRTPADLPRACGAADR
jgi:hypothetical protein